jgi:hypothetical protein
MATDRVPPGAIRRTVIVHSLLACVTALSAACTSGAGATPVPTAIGGSAASASPSAGDGVGASANAVASARSTSVGGGTSAAPATAGGPGACLARYLHADLGQSQGAAGSTYVTLTFKNLNNVACTLHGYPGVSFGAGTPVAQVGQAATRDSSVAPVLITLAPGGYAHTTLRITNALNYPTSTCAPASTTWLQVYPPNSFNQLYVPYNGTACTSKIVTLSVQAVQAGQGG